MSADSSYNPITMLRTATKAVPVVKYATGLVGIAAAISLIRTFLGDMSLLEMLPLILGTMACMAVLIVLASSISPARNKGISPGAVLLWAACILMIVSMSLTVTAVAFGWPSQLAQQLPGEAADKPIFTGLTPRTELTEATDDGITSGNASSGTPIEAAQRVNRPEGGATGGAATEVGGSRVGVTENESTTNVSVGNDNHVTAATPVGNGLSGPTTGGARPTNSNRTGVPRASPNPNATPNYESVRLEADFDNDPRVVALRAGGALDASSVRANCSGFITAAPDVRLRYRAGDFPLILSVASDADTTLVVNAPDGSWHCDDDNGANGLNPAIRFNSPASGRYEIWVGSYRADARPPARLHISEFASQ